MALCLARSIGTCEDRQIGPLSRELRATMVDLMSWRRRTDPGW
jgi:hypothetical protein